MSGNIKDDQHTYDVEIAQSTYQHIEPGALINSGGLATCTGVFIYSKKLQEAFAGHFDAVYCDLEKMVKEAKTLFKGHSLDIYITGCSGVGKESIFEGCGITEEDLPDVEEEKFDQRAYTEKVLRRAFQQARSHIRWGFFESTSIMTLNTLNGKATLEMTNVDDNVIYEGDFNRCPVYK